MASNMGAQKARAMKSGSGAFDVDDFVSKLITFMGGRKPLEESLPQDSDDGEDGDGEASLDWDRIGRKALAKSRRVPVMGFMSIDPFFICRISHTVFHFKGWALSPLNRKKEPR